MSDEKLSAEELKGVVGGAKYSVSSQTAEGRNQWIESPEVGPPEPLGGPENDPIYSDLLAEPKG